VDFFHNDATRLLRLNKGTANQIKMYGGGGTTGDDLIVFTNIVDTYPRFNLYGNSNFRISVPVGSSMQVYEGSGTKMFDFGSEAIHMLETATPTAQANMGAIYTKNDNELYFQTGAGVEKTVTTV